MKSMSSETTGERSGGRTPVTSTQAVRDLNSSLVLDHFWQAPADAGLIATDLVAGTGLTRSTVLAIADELREAGWLHEDRAPSLVPGRGRQARRFTFNKQRCLVVACDIGYRSATCVVADLKGELLGRASRRFDGREAAVDRTGEVLEAVVEALQSAQVAPERVQAACFGLAAPIDRHGEPYPGNPFWDAVRLDFQRLRDFAPGWIWAVENDADLAAMAEISQPGRQGLDSSVTLLAGEWLGAGIVINGEVFRGANGGAGEMAFLERVSGVGSSLGPSAVARTALGEALVAGQNSVLEGQRRPSLAAIADAAASGDRAAREAIARTEEQLALAISTLSGFLDPGTVIIAGGNAGVLAPLLERIQDRLAQLVAFPPALQASLLGRDVVLLGAVQRALAAVRAAALEA